MVSVLLPALLCLVVNVYGGCPTGFVYHRRSCYWFSVVEGSFAEAHVYCQYLGCHLATIETKDEDSFIRGHALRRGKAPYYWLGASDLNTEGKWLWEGQRKLIYSNWSPGQPDNYKHREHCLEIRKSLANYQWNDRPCERQLHFICEKDH